MSDNLVGFRYIQALQPEHGYVGFQWFDTDTSQLFEWTGTNEYPDIDDEGGSWNQVYYGNQPDGGLLKLSGGTMTGNISGITGWAASDNYNFPTSLKVSGQNVATVSYVNQQVTSFNDLISAKISQAIASSTSSINTNANIGKYGAGVSGNGYFEPTIAANQQSATVPPNFAPIPLPRYTDGSLASETECIWVGAPAGMYLGTGNAAGLITGDANNEGSDFYVVQTFDQVSARVFRHYWATYEVSGGVRNLRNGYLAGGMFWMILGVKASS
jgi:hypothetical protein